MTSPLTEKQERLLILFKQAIEREREAQKLYGEMLNNCEDAELKRVIESFRSEERMHEEKLMLQYETLKEVTTNK